MKKLLAQSRPVLRPSEKLARLEWQEKMDSSGHPVVVKRSNPDDRDESE
jgi:hypothetical protein